MEAEYSGHKSHQLCSENIGTFQNRPSGCGLLFKRDSNDGLTLFDCILLFCVDLLIHRYWDKKMGWREDACAPKKHTGFSWCWTLTFTGESLKVHNPAVSLLLRTLPHSSPWRSGEWGGFWTWIWALSTREAMHENHDLQTWAKLPDQRLPELVSTKIRKHKTLKLPK